MVYVCCDWSSFFLLALVYDTHPKTAQLCPLCFSPIRGILNLVFPWVVIFLAELHFSRVMYSLMTSQLTARSRNMQIQISFFAAVHHCSGTGRGVIFHVVIGCFQSFLSVYIFSRSVVNCRS